MPTVVATPTVSLGDLQLQVEQDDGVLYLLEKTSGWGSPAVDRTVEQKEWGHGAWAGVGYLAARPLVLEGTVIAPEAQLRAAIDRLIDAASLEDTRFQVDEDVSRYCTVRRNDEVLVDHLNKQAARWSVQMLAPDPRKYSVAESSAVLGLPTVTGGLVLPATAPLTIGATVVTGRAQLLNAGNIDAGLTVRIDGPVSQPRFSLTTEASSQTLRFNLDLATGQWLEIDTARRTAYLNGTSSRRGLATGDWPLLPPGASELNFAAALYDPDALLTVTYRSAWK